MRRRAREEQPATDRRTRLWGRRAREQQPATDRRTRLWGRRVREQKLDIGRVKRIRLLGTRQRVRRLLQQLNGLAARAKPLLERIRPPVPDTAADQTPTKSVRASVLSATLCLGMAALLVSGKIVEIADRLPLGPDRDRWLEAATETDRLANRLALNRPYDLLRDLRGAGDDAGQQIDVIGEVDDLLQLEFGAATEQPPTTTTSALPEEAVAVPTTSVSTTDTSGTTTATATATATDTSDTATATDTDTATATATATDTSGTATATDTDTATATATATDTSGTTTATDTDTATATATDTSDTSDTATATDTSDTSDTATATDTSGTTDTATATTTTTTTSTTTTTVPPEPPSYVRPAPVSSDSPLRTFVAGDSQAFYLGHGLRESRLSDVLDITLNQRHSTGLARPSYFNWPVHFFAIAAQFDPEVVVATLGSNDWQSMMSLEGQTLGRGSDEWRAEWRRRLGVAFDVLEAPHRQVIWVGLPPTRSDEFREGYAVMNQLAVTAAAERDFVTMIDIWDMFGGDEPYRDAVPPPGDPEGRPVDVRHQDGVHLNQTGSRWVVDLINDEIERIVAAVSPEATAAPEPEPEPAPS